MRDRKFLIWLHERLIHQHKEPFGMDYMNKLRSIIVAYPVSAETVNNCREEVFAQVRKQEETL